MQIFFNWKIETVYCWFKLPSASYICEIVRCYCRVDTWRNNRRTGPASRGNVGGRRCCSSRSARRHRWIRARPDRSHTYHPWNSGNGTHRYCVCGRRSQKCLRTAIGNRSLHRTSSGRPCGSPAYCSRYLRLDDRSTSKSGRVSRRRVMYFKAEPYVTVPCLWSAPDHVQCP